MNIIGEKPIEIKINGINIIATLSYKFLNDTSFSKEKKRNEKLEKIFKEKNFKSIGFYSLRERFMNNLRTTNKIKQINYLFKQLSEFINKKTSPLIIETQNCHLRFEDEDFINDNGNFVFGFKLKSFIFNRSCQTVSKNIFFQLNNLDFYWEPKPKIIIPYQFLEKLLNKDKNLNDYFKDIEKINLTNFHYIEGTKFIIKNGSFYFNVGNKLFNPNDISFSLKEKENHIIYFEMFINNLCINFDKEFILLFRLLIIFLIKYNFLHENIRDYRPLIKPITKNIEKENKNINKKDIVKDWLSYIYLYRKKIMNKYNVLLNPVYYEFIKYYNFCKNNNTEIIKELKDIIKDIEDKSENKLLEIDKNISFQINIKINSLNINHNSNSKYNILFSLILTDINFQILIDKKTTKINFSILKLSFGPKNIFKKGNDDDNKKSNNLFNQNNTNQLSERLLMPYNLKHEKKFNKTIIIEKKEVMFSNSFEFENNNCNMSFKNKLLLDKCDYYLFEIFPLFNKKALSFNLTIYHNSQEIDNIRIEFGDIRLNIFEQYITDLINSLYEYKPIFKIYNLRKRFNFLLNEKIQKVMKEYIYNYLSKLPENEKTQEIKYYSEYLKQNLNGEQFIKELKIINNYFINGIEIYIIHGKIECILYNRNEQKKSNSILFKSTISPNKSYLKLYKNTIIVSLFKYYFEINNYNEFNNSINLIKQIIIDKFLIFKHIIEPFFIKYKSQINFDISSLKKNKTKK